MAKIGRFQSNSTIDSRQRSRLTVRGYNGNVEKKVDFVTGLFEQEVKVADVFNQDEMIDIVGVCNDDLKGSIDREVVLLLGEVGTWQLVGLQPVCFGSSRE